MTDVIERLRDANPVPRDLSTGWSRSDEGWSARGGSTRFARRRPSRVPAALVAAVLVVALAASVALLTDDTGTTPAETRDPSALVHGTWSRLPAIPNPKFDPMTTIWTGRQLLTFGRTRADASWSGYRLTDRGWRRTASPLQAVDRGLTVWTGKEVLSWLVGQRYDPRADKWSRMATFPLTVLRGSPLATWTGDELVVVVDARAFAYTPSDDHWVEFSGPPFALEMAGAVWDGNRIVYVEGSGYASGIVEDHAVAYTPTADTWEDLGPAPPGGEASYGSLAAPGRQVVRVGWLRPSGRSILTADRLVVTGDVWVPAAPDLTEGAGVYPCTPGPAAAQRDVVVASAGSNQSVLLDVAAGRWRTLPRAPEALDQAFWTGRSLIAVTQRGRFVRLS